MHSAQCCIDRTLLYPGNLLKRQIVLPHYKYFPLFTRQLFEQRFQTLVQLLRADYAAWIAGVIDVFRQFAIDLKTSYMQNIKEVFLSENIEKLTFTNNDLVIPETVGQYTGLTDKNGTKIFEGDIVRCRHNWRLQVYPNDGIDAEKYFFEQKIRGAYGKYKHEPFDSWWEKEYFYFRNYAVEYYAPNGEFRVRNGGQFHALTSNYIINRDLEIIGNIHDNPELLKEGDSGG